MADIAAGGMDFRAGHVIARSFSTLFRNIAPFGLLALVLTSPTYVYAILTGFGDTMAYGAEVIVEQFVIGIVNFLLGYLVTAALVFGTIQNLRNHKVSIGKCFSQGVARMFPVLFIAIVSGILTALATLAFVIPGIIVAIMLWVTIPVAVIERRGLGSLGRSMDLTKGYRWRILYLVFLQLGVLSGIGSLMGVLTAAILVTGVDSSGEFGTTSQTGVLAIQWISSAFISALMAVIAAVFD